MTEKFFSTYLGDLQTKEQFAGEGQHHLIRLRYTLVNSHSCRNHVEMFSSKQRAANDEISEQFSNFGAYVANAKKTRSKWF